MSVIKFPVVRLKEGFEQEPSTFVEVLEMDLNNLSSTEVEILDDLKPDPEAWTRLFAGLRA